jgi:UDP-N-acetylmuramate--alanine ligase
VERDHLDYFGDFESLRDAFRQFVARVHPGGTAVLSADDPVATALPMEVARRVTYGLAEDAAWRVLDWTPIGRLRSRFALRDPAGRVHDLEINLTGRHNAVNAAAVVAVCSALGLSMDQIADGLRFFIGTKRRFEVLGEVGDIVVADDYAHHPTALRVTLEAAQAHFGSPIWAIFQPHTVHRTLSLWEDFQQCFGAAAHVILVPTYRPPGREAEEDDPTVARLASDMDHPDARWMPAEEVARTVVDTASPGDLVLVLGAGDVWTIGPRIVKGLKVRFAQAEPGPQLSSSGRSER